jgi:hypothetical protein
MKIEVIKPLLPDDFVEKVKVDVNGIEKNYFTIFQYE